ncbi:MAG: hypothetical protein KUG80_04885 [Gammaproteobacteria bacterium]|nr:hypothetical protein [Gammaproteobacteria bacterium]
MKKIITVLSMAFLLQACSLDLAGGAGVSGDASVLGHPIAGGAANVGAGTSLDFGISQ